MVQDSGGPDIEALVEKATRRRASRRCWVEFIPERAAEYMEMLLKRDAKAPGIVNRAEARRILLEEFPEIPEPSREQFNRHFRGECKCDREDA